MFFSAARVVGVNARQLTYTVDWDNEDLEQVSVLPYDRVALDQPPERDDVGIGAEVLFPQGKYFCNLCDVNHSRYFQGVITSITKRAGDESKEPGDEPKGTGVSEIGGGTGDSSCEWSVTGERLQPSYMGYLLNSSTYNHYFENIALHDIRLPPTAFDFLEMCLEEEQEGEEDESMFVRSFSVF